MTLSRHTRIADARTSPHLYTAVRTQSASALWCVASASRALPLPPSVQTQNGYERLVSKKYIVLPLKRFAVSRFFPRTHLTAHQASSPRVHIKYNGGAERRTAAAGVSPSTAAFIRRRVHWRLSCGAHTRTARARPPRALHSSVLHSLCGLSTRHRTGVRAAARGARRGAATDSRSIQRPSGPPSAPDVFPSRSTLARSLAHHTCTQPWEDARAAQLAVPSASETVTDA